MRHVNNNPLIYLTSFSFSRFESKRELNASRDCVFAGLVVSFDGLCVGKTCLLRHISQFFVVSLMDVLIEFQEAFWDHSTFDFSSFRKNLFSLLTEKLSRHQLTKDRKLIDEMKFQWWMFVLLTSEDVGGLTARIIGCDIFFSIYVDHNCLSKRFLGYWPFSK